MSDVVIHGTTFGPCGCCNPAPPVCLTWNTNFLPAFMFPGVDLSCVMFASDYRGPPATDYIIASDGSKLTASVNRAASSASGYDIAGAIFVEAGKKIQVDGNISGGAIVNMNIQIYGEFGGFPLDNQTLTVSPFSYEFEAPDDGLYLVVLRGSAFEPPFGPTPVGSDFVIKADGPALIYCIEGDAACPWCICAGLP